MSLQEATSLSGKGSLTRDKTGFLIGLVPYFNILTWLQGSQVKIANFSLFFLDSQKKTPPNIKVCPDSLGALLEYRYSKRVYVG